MSVGDRDLHFSDCQTDAVGMDGRCCRAGRRQGEARHQAGHDEAPAAEAVVRIR
jgi:hypothetical protein